MIDYQCPKWCTADHTGEDLARREADDARLHTREVGRVHNMTVTVEAAQNLDTGTWESPTVSVLGDTTCFTPVQAFELEQLIHTAIRFCAPE